MLSRSEVLNKLGGLNTTLLNKLYDYSSQTIIPDKDLLINATMSTMLTKAHQLADAVFPEWTDRGSNDFGEFLVQLMCLFSEKDFNYVNIFQRESHLPTMQIYANAYLRCLELGYIPQVFTSATSMFGIVFSGGIDTVVTAGSVGIAVGVYSFTNIVDFPVAFSAGTQSVALTLHEGRWVNVSYEYSGVPIQLLETNIDVSTIVVTSGTNTYKRVIYFGGTDMSSLVWYALFEESSRVSVVFGDGVYGVPPNVGAVVSISYLVSTADSTKTIYPILPIVNKIPPNRNIISANLVGAILQAVSQESLLSLKFNAPILFKTKGRILNEFDCEQLLGSQVEVVKAKCFYFEGIFYFYVVPYLSTQTDLNAILEARFADVSVIGTALRGLAVTYFDVTPFSANIYILQGYSFETVAFECYAALSDFFNPALSYAQLGQAVNYYSLVNHVIGSAQGVQNVVITQVAGAAPNYAATQVIDKGTITKILSPYVPTVTQSDGYYKIVCAGVTLNFYYAN